MQIIEKIKSIPSVISELFNKSELSSTTESNKDEYGFSYSKLSLVELTKWVNITTLLEAQAIDTSNCLPFIFSHLEADLGIHKDQEILGLWIDYPNIEIEEIVEELFLDKEQTHENKINVHRILFNKKIVGFFTGKGELYRDEFFTISDNVAYLEMLQFIRDTYENVPNA
jgi:hypothetical protein